MTEPTDDATVDELLGDEGTDEAPADDTPEFRDTGDRERLTRDDEQGERLDPNAAQVEADEASDEASDEAPDDEPTDPPATSER